MDPQVINTVKIVELILFLILATIFCVLVLFILVYYIRRRYRLYKEISRISQELLIKESYRNHIKNLKLKCIINNFIIVILVMEIILNFGEILNYLPSVIGFFVKDHGYNFRNLFEVQTYSSMFTLTIYYSFVPVLSMLMDSLWLAYRKYEYKYNMIRWTWYIVIRISVNFLLKPSYNLISIPVDYEIVFYYLVNAFLGIFPIIDFLQFVYYVRKFYLHLKSREKEIRLFYFDNKTYLDSKYLRIDYKIATILVGFALLFFNLSSPANLFAIFYDIPYYIPISQKLYPIISIVYHIYIGFICILAYYISQVLFIFNYLYIFIVVVYKAYRDGQKLKNINDYIKPIMKQYHDNYHNRYTNYA